MIWIVHRWGRLYKHFQWWIYIDFVESWNKKIIKIVFALLRASDTVAWFELWKFVLSKHETYKKKSHHKVIKPERMTWLLLNWTSIFCGRHSKLYNCRIDSVHVQTCARISIKNHSTCITYKCAKSLKKTTYFRIQNVFTVILLDILFHFILVSEVFLSELLLDWGWTNHTLKTSWESETLKSLR